MNEIFSMLLFSLMTAVMGTNSEVQTISGDEIEKEDIAMPESGPAEKRPERNFRIPKWFLREVLGIRGFKPHRNLGAYLAASQEEEIKEHIVFYLRKYPSRMTDVLSLLSEYIQAQPETPQIIFVSRISEQGKEQGDVMNLMRLLVEALQDTRLQDIQERLMTR